MIVTHHDVTSHSLERRLVKRIFIVLAVIIAGFVASATPAMALSTSKFSANPTVRVATTWHSKAFSTSKGGVYVTTRLGVNSLCADKPDYSVSIQQLTQGTWSPVTTAKSHTANGNTDTFGFDAGVNKGGTYRVGIHNKGSITPLMCAAYGAVSINPTYDPDHNGK
jgi:hypothetical protein